MTSYALAPQPRLGVRSLPVPEWNGFRSAFQSFADGSRNAAAVAIRAPAQAAARPMPAQGLTEIPGWPVAAGAAAILSVKLSMLWLTFLPA